MRYLIPDARTVTGPALGLGEVLLHPIEQLIKILLFYRIFGSGEISATVEAFEVLRTRIDRETRKAKSIRSSVETIRLCSKVSKGLGVT